MDMTDPQAQQEDDPGLIIVDQTQWTNMVAKIESDPESEANKNLQLFLEHLSARENAQNSIMQVFGEQASMLAEQIAHVADTMTADFYHQHRQAVAELEADILKTMVSNHARRQNIVMSLETAKRVVDATTDSLMAQVLNIPVEPTTHASDYLTKDASKDDGSDNNLSGKKRAAMEDAHGLLQDDGNGDMEPADLDWDAIGELYELAIPNIQAFLDTRAKMQDAEAKFGQAVTELGQTFQDLLGKLEGVVQDAYVTINQQLDHTQSDIQECMMSNTERRERYEELIHERAKAAESLFSRLMTRTLGGVGRNVMKGFGFNKKDKQHKRK